MARCISLPRTASSSVLLVLMTGCSGNSPPPLPPLPPSPSPVQTAAPSLPETPPVAAAAAPTQPSPVIKMLETYLLENFGMPGFETPWYANIKGLTVQGETLLVATDLEPNNPKLKGICGGVSGFVYSGDNRDAGLQQVKVLGPGDKLLVHRKSLADKCGP